MASPYSQSETAYVYPIAAREEGNEVSAAARGPPGHQPCLGHYVVLPPTIPSQAPLCFPLYCTVRATPTPTNRFSPILPPGQDWSQKELLEAAVSSLQLWSEQAPALLSILPVL